MDRRSCLNYRQADRHPDDNDGFHFRVNCLRSEFFRHPRLEQGHVPAPGRSKAHQRDVQTRTFFKDLPLQFTVHCLSMERAVINRFGGYAATA